MTQDEIYQHERKVREMPDGIEKKTAQTECSCVRMINSILAYQCRGCKEASKVLDYELSRRYSYLKEYVFELGRERVEELVQGQINSIKYVATDVATDEDGIHYNSIVWA